MNNKLLRLLVQASAFILFVIFLGSISLPPAQAAGSSDAAPAIQTTAAAGAVKPVSASPTPIPEFHLYLSMVRRGWPPRPVPLMDMGTATYFGIPGGLYPLGSNTPPEAHTQAGLERADLVQPRNLAGDISPEGKILFLSIGMSNTHHEFCSSTFAQNCTPESFVGQARQDPQVNLAQVKFLNGALGGQDAREWESPQSPNYTLIEENLAEMNASAAQVQVIWLKVVNNLGNYPLPSLPNTQADAYDLVFRLGNIVRTLKIRYPNLQEVFLSSRIYGGYSNTYANPEPYAYESGFAVKWLIEAQIDQMETGEIDPLAGDLNYETSAPWLAWSAYLWADGLNPRSDGLVWLPEDFADDGTHPSASGILKVGSQLLNFFKTSPFTAPWFLIAPEGG